MRQIGWEHLSPEEREREYSPSSCIGGNYQPFIRDYARLSAEARGKHAARTFRYGEKPGQTLDLFLPEAGGSRPPVVVFFHGGYWQELSKLESAFAAPHCLSQGVAFAAVDYTLAPAASLDDIVEECSAALSWLARSDAGIDPQRIVVAGSSAGAHLAAMASLGTGIAKGAMLVSGIYDLEPLIGTSINEALRLDAEAARRNSPLHLNLAGFPRAVVCWGEIETEQSKRQSMVFADTLEAAGCSCVAFESAGRNHFDVIFDLADPATLLGRHLHELVRLTGHRDAAT